LLCLCEYLFVMELVRFTLDVKLIAIEVEVFDEPSTLIGLWIPIFWIGWSELFDFLVMTCVHKWWPLLHFLQACGITQFFELSCYSSDNLWMCWLTLVHLCSFLNMSFMLLHNQVNQNCLIFCLWLVSIQVMTYAALFASMCYHSIFGTFML